MPTQTGYIERFQASDSGTGDPRDTIWELKVGGLLLTTKNGKLAEAAKLAIMTASSVEVIYGPTGFDVISEIRMQFSYVCTAEPIQDCFVQPAPTPGTRYVCGTKRYAPCEPGQVG